MNVPVNDLHNCGYTSIGCEPCTRPVLPNQQVNTARDPTHFGTAPCYVRCNG